MGQVPEPVQLQPPGGMRTVLILGAGEILETHLEQALATYAAYRPMLVSRRNAGSIAEELRRNIGDGRHLLDGVDCVVNCIGGSPGGIFSVTKALFDAARRYPPRRIIHVSSMSIYGNARGIVDESTEPVPPLNAYMRTRIECEAMVRQYAADGGDAIILRPSCILGPNSEAWCNRIARLLSSGRLGDLGVAGDGICNMIPVDDLVSAIIAMLSSDAISGEIFNVSAGGTPPTWNQFLLRFARAIGATPVRRISARRLRLETRVVAPMLRLLGMTLGRLGVGVKLPDALTPSFVRSLQQDIIISTDKLSHQLQRNPPPLGQQIEQSAQSWAAHRARMGSGFAPAGRETSSAGMHR